MPGKSWSRREMVLIHCGLSVLFILSFCTILMSIVYLNYDDTVIKKFVDMHPHYSNFNIYIVCIFCIFVLFMYFRLYVEFDSIKLQMRPLDPYLDFFMFILFFTLTAVSMNIAMFLSVANFFYFLVFEL